MAKSLREKILYEIYGDDPEHHRWVRRKRMDKIISLIIERVKGIENPYEPEILGGYPPSNWTPDFKNVFNEALQVVIKELKR